MWTLFNYIFRFFWLVLGAYDLGAAFECFANGRYFIGGCYGMAAVYCIIYLVKVIRDYTEIQFEKEQTDLD